MYIGIPAVQNIVIYYFSRTFFVQAYHKNRRFDFNSYWKHCLGTSVAGRMIASQLSAVDSHKIFTYGLIHDIGVAILSHCLPEPLDEMTLLMKKGMDQVNAERIVFNGMSHQEMGAWICLKLGIQRDITDVIEFHHRPLEARENQRNTLIVHIADLISTEYYQKLLGIRLNSQFYDCIEKFNLISKKQAVTIAVALPNEIEKLEKLFSL